MFPGFLLQPPVLQWLPGVFVVEVVGVGGDAKMAAPSQLTSFEREDAFRLAENGTQVRMVVVRRVRQVLLIRFLSPRIVGLSLAAPAHSGLVVGFIALKSLFARPGIADALDVLAFLRRCRRRKRRWGGSGDWNLRQHEARAVVSSEGERCGHCIGRGQDHWPQRIRN